MVLFSRKKETDVLYCVKVSVQNLDRPPWRAVARETVVKHKQLKRTFTQESVAVNMDVPFKDPEFVFKIRQTIETHGLLGHNDSVLVAVSGGADSVVLLDLLVGLKDMYGLKMAVAHLDHGLRGRESRQDRRFVEQLAETYAIPCYSRKIDVAKIGIEQKLSLEEAARNVRYSFLFDTADEHGFNRIATAHHGDDNAELVLMNLMRGSGPSGLSGMDYMSRNSRLVRPLLDVGRTEIMAYLNLRGLRFRLDSSNRDTVHLRNRVRLELIPLIESDYQKGFRRTVMRTARLIRDDEAWIGELVNPYYEKSVRASEPGRILLDIPVLRPYPQPLKRRIIRRALLHVKGDLKRVGWVHVDDISRLIDREKGRASLDLPGRVRVMKDRDILVFERKFRNLRTIPPFMISRDAHDYDYAVHKPLKGFREVFIEDTGLVLRVSSMADLDSTTLRSSESSTAYLDMDCLNFPLSLRNARPGDRFRPLGMAGRQRVSRFLSQSDVPEAQRGETPVLVSDQDIVWVCGHRIDESYKVVSSTENILKVELFLA